MYVNSKCPVGKVIKSTKRPNPYDPLELLCALKTYQKHIPSMLFAINIKNIRFNKSPTYWATYLQDEHVVPHNSKYLYAFPMYAWMLDYSKHHVYAQFHLIVYNFILCKSH